MSGSQSGNRALLHPWSDIISDWALGWLWTKEVCSLKMVSELKL
jgi:hypothetical protein